MFLKNLYYELAAKVNNINTNEFVLKIKFDTDKSNLENIITDGDKKKKLLLLVGLLNYRL